MSEPFAPFVFTAPLEVDLEADDAVAQLIAVRATTAAAPWRDAAATVWIRVVEDLREDDARALLDALVASLEPDPDRMFALADQLCAKVSNVYPKWSAALRREALAVALPDPAYAEHAIELALQLVHDLDEDLERDAIPAVIGEVLARFPERAYELHVRFFDVLRAGWRTQELASDQARAALALAPDRDARLDLLTKLAAMLREKSAYDEDERAAWTAVHASLVPELAALVVELAPSAAVVRAHLELAEDVRPGVSRSELAQEPPPSPVQLHHAASADELARRIGADLELVHEAAHAHAELLLRAGELARAEAVLATLPGLDDDHLATVGFLEHLRRLLGLASEPPPEAFVTHDPPDPVFDFFAKAELPEGFAAYFTRDPDPLVMLREDRHVSPEIARTWSHGEVRCEADLDSQKIFGPLRDYACGCTRYLGARYGGFVCERCGVEVIRAITRTYRPGHVALARPVLHPWYLAPLAILFDTTQAALRDADPDELRERLQRLDRYYLYHAAEETRASYSRRERAKLPVLEALRDSRVRPEWLLFDIVPVWAPAAVLPTGVDRAKLRAAYVAMLEPDPRRGVDALFACFKR